MSEYIYLECKNNVRTRVDISGKMRRVEQMGLTPYEHCSNILPRVWRRVDETFDIVYELLVILHQRHIGGK